MKKITIPAHMQTIVWDLDSTLLDSFGIYRDCLNEVLTNLGRPPIDEQIFWNNHHGFIEDSIASVLREAGQEYSASGSARQMGRLRADCSVA